MTNEGDLAFLSLGGLDYSRRFEVLYSEGKGNGGGLAIIAIDNDEIYVEAATSSGGMRAGLVLSTLDFVRALREWRRVRFDWVVCERTRQGLSIDLYFTLHWNDRSIDFGVCRDDKAPLLLTYAEPVTLLKRICRKRSIEV